MSKNVSCAWCFIFIIECFQIFVNFLYSDVKECRKKIGRSWKAAVLLLLYNAFPLNSIQFLDWVTHRIRTFQPHKCIEQYGFFFWYVFQSKQTEISNKITCVLSIWLLLLLLLLVYCFEVNFCWRNPLFLAFSFSSSLSTAQFSISRRKLWSN